MEPREASPRVGLCVDCEHSRVVESARGSRFYLCRLSETDARFPRYPPLPVLHCVGYAPGDQIVADDEDNLTTNR
jgi:hypothetical protein